MGTTVPQGPNPQQVLLGTWAHSGMTSGFQPQFGFQGLVVSDMDVSSSQVMDGTALHTLALALYTASSLEVYSAKFSKEGGYFREQGMPTC